LSAIRSIAHYTVEQELGRGGMGVVYRAIDTKLGRAVAIKSLPAEFVQDVVWRTRFEAEARTLAAINHPNIAAIYGLETDETGAYLVLELAEGPTLGDRIHTAPPAMSEALEFCRQIALGLSVAHDRDIVHRDLKPANVKVRPDGLVKVLDFGIAKSGRNDDAADPFAATLVQKVNPVSTVPAFLLGTPGYMSPEQARGGAISPATDVWALGCVLYETLAHQMAFGGDTLADSIALTILGEPDYAALPRQTPGRILRLMQACLAKKASARPASMREVTATLEDSLRELSVGRVFMSGTAAAPADDDGPAETGNIPSPGPTLLGRDPLIQQICESLEARRLVTLTGPAGSGLSSLAAAVGEKSIPAFRAGAWWVPLPPIPDPALHAALVAFSLNVRGRASGVIPELIECIGARRMLLVLDGVAVGASSLAGDLLRACPNLRILATARSSLHAHGEQVIPVPPLGGPADSPSHLDPAKLFLDLLSPIDAGPWKEKPSDTVRVCNLLKGNPLVISLAAGLAPVVGQQHFEAQLRQRVQLAGHTELEAVTSERLVQVLASWALDGQPVGNLAVLLRASVFVGVWSAALPTPPEVRISDQLERLIKAGLVRRTTQTEDPTIPSFMLPDAVRREASLRLNATPGAAALVHSGYLAFANALASLATGPLTHTAALQLQLYYAELANAATKGGDAPSIELAQQALLRHHSLA
jgi:hypothetical protein